MDKTITIISKVDQERADKEYWKNTTIEKRIEAFNIIMQNYITLTYGSNTGFQRVIRIVKQKRS